MSHATGERIRVLHVDDEPDFAGMAASFLEREDDRIDVETATSATEGLDHLENGDFDCIVSDYDMPEVDGVEFLQAVREKHPEIPFILFTGKGSEEIASEAISAGVTDYLQKTGGTDQYAILANRITNVVAGHRSRRALEERKRRLETLISNLPGIVYRCRNAPGWPMEVVEGECEELTGYPAVALERGDVLWGEDVLHPDDRDAMWGTVQEALEAGDSFEVTYRIRTADGETRWMWERGREVTAADGDVTVLEGFITDITARKTREADLERTNALLSTLFDALPVGVLAEDASREVMAANERLVDLFDLSETSEEIVGADCAALAEEVADAFADSVGFVDGIENLTAARTPAEDELDLRDGRTFERSYRPIELPDGDGHLWVYRDITDRKRREEELELYETLVESAAGGVFATDAEGRYAFVNSHIEERTGYDASEIVGKRPADFMPADDVAEINDEIREMLAGDRETVTYESTLTAADGEEIPIEGRLALLPSDDGFRGTVGVVRDVTDRKERERKLERLRDRTQALMYTETKAETAEVATDAAADIIGAQLSGVHLLNDAGDVMEPVAVTETVAAQFDDIPTYPRNADEGTRAAIVWDVFTSEEPFRVADTRTHDALAESTPARSVILHPIGRHGVFVVSAGEPDAFDDADESLIEILATSLETAMDRVEREAELRRRNERLEEFASVVSHDLRNPLNVARGRFELARETGAEHHHEAVARAHERMETLIEDLLTLAREGEEITDLEPCDLDALGERCWRNVETAEASLVVDADRTVRADRTRLEQLLENIFRNAVEHAGPDVVVRIGDLDGGFYVEDDGPGIPPDEREAVFEAGYSTDEEGTGFGLAIVRRIADAHGWDVTVTEGRDGGARFGITGVDVAE